MEAIETQPELVVEEQPAVGFFNKVKTYKFKILGGVLGILVFAGAIFGAYKIGQKQIQPGSQPTPTSGVVTTPAPDPTADWQTYTNTEYGYSIKYPKDWNTSEPEGGPEKGRRINFHPWRERSFDKVDYQISIIVNDVGYEKSLTVWLDEKIGSYSEEIKSLITREKVTLDNFEGEKVLEEVSQAGVYNIYTKKNSFIYNFMLAPYSPKELSQLLPESLDYFNLILSTFKFLEGGEPTPSPTSIEKITYKSISSWQAYTDSRENFSVQYPQDYKLGGTEELNGIYFVYLWSCVGKGGGEEPLCMSGYDIQVHYDYDGGSRRAWLLEKFPSMGNLYIEEVEVQGIKSLILMDGNTGGSTGSIVGIPKGTKMYVFGFPGGWNPDTKEKPSLGFIKQVLSTFKFLD